MRTKCVEQEELHRSSLVPFHVTRSAYNFEEVVQGVAVEFEVQFLHDDQLHPVHITSREAAAVVLHHGSKDCVHRLYIQ